MTETEKIEVTKLVAQAKEGKQLAFTKLYNKYYKLIRYIIYETVHNLDVAEDLTSVTFTKAFMKIDTFTENISFEMWLKTIAINSSIDYIRRVKEEQSNVFVDDDDCFIQLGSLDSSPEDKLIENENLNRVNIAFDKLRPKYKNLINMKVNEGLSYAQISAKTGLDESQVKSLLNSARNRLRQFINQ